MSITETYSLSRLDQCCLFVCLGGIKQQKKNTKITWKKKQNYVGLGNFKHKKNSKSEKFNLRQNDETITW